ncbi:MAG TPA: S9 family peptidase [Luteibacter sp.]|jgi:dipeptidyl aminopeptidase/acylaminoacyl peptidase|nr:S9 family peptidase [Luteibacter sp.]
MRSMLLAAAIAAGLTQTVFAATVPVQAPLIARSALFGNPSQVYGTLSPDGKWLAWIAPRDGVMNIWIAPRDQPTHGKPVTAESKQPIRFYSWAPDSSAVLFSNDKDGDENYQLYKASVDGNAAVQLTSFAKTRVRTFPPSHHIKDRILIGLNNRDARWYDIYSLELKTGKLKKLFENTGDYANFILDDALVLRIAARQRKDGGADYYRMHDGKVDAKPFASVDHVDTRGTMPSGFSADGKTLYWLDSRGRDTAALFAQDTATGKTQLLAENPKADIGDVLVDPATGKVQAYAVEYLKTEWTALDPAIAPDLAFLEGKLKGNVQVTSRTQADDVWTVDVDPVSSPSSTYLYDRKAKSLTLLFVNRPELAKATLSPMYPEVIRSRDGLEQVSYLTLPPGSDTRRAGHPDRPLPMVLFVHGGPWDRDDYGYNRYHQWLANRGYAVLSVNFRGSTGFGKKYMSAGDLEWGAKMQDDLTDAVHWAIDAGVTTKDRVAIMGESYGGYATLAGLTFTPDVYACGVEVAGPTNLNTLLKAIPPYWEAIRRDLYQRVGDPETAEGRQLLHDRSPLNKADAIARPLLIGQGANDPRVTHVEADEIVAAMAAKKISVTYAVFPDEGHGFARPENNIAFNAVAEQFLGKCLGGRAEPIGDALKASTITVPHGAAFAPGLSEALAAPK